MYTHTNTHTHTHTHTHIQKRGNLKGFIDLSKVKVVEKVLDGAFDKPSFQVYLPVYNNITIHVLHVCTVNVHNNTIGDTFAVLITPG